VQDIRDVCDEELQAWHDRGLFVNKPIRFMHETAPIGRIVRIWRDGFRWMVAFELDVGSRLGRTVAGMVSSPFGACFRVTRRCGLRLARAFE
jgi:hypothetical protein